MAGTLGHTRAFDLPAGAALFLPESPATVALDHWADLAMYSDSDMLRSLYGGGEAAPLPLASGSLPHDETSNDSPLSQDCRFLLNQAQQPDPALLAQCCAYFAAPSPQDVFQQAASRDTSLQRTSSAATDEHPGNTATAATSKRGGNGKAKAAKAPKGGARRGKGGVAKAAALPPKRPLFSGFVLPFDRFAAPAKGSISLADLNKKIAECCPQC